MLSRIYSPPMSSPFSCSSVGQRTFPTTAFQHRHGFQFRDATAISAKIYRSDWTRPFLCVREERPHDLAFARPAKFPSRTSVHRLLYTAVVWKQVEECFFKKFIDFQKKLEFESVERWGQDWLDWLLVAIIVRIA